MVAFRDGTVQRENKKWEWHRRSGSITGLLRSCRTVYSEAIGILYTKNILQVRQARTIVEFPLVMRHHRLATIRKLHLDTRLSPNWDIEHWSINKWNGALHVVKTYMQGLQHFRVSFGVTHEGAAVHDEELVALIRNLSYVKHVRDFVIEFHWWREVDELLVRVGRPPEGFPFRVEVHDILDQPGRPW
ncbi:hypothetical protein BJY01DRAFT_252252 [Aspergillus pseudoustus]|uniref:DUF7730 domain-containing protein n=1 Tax=Aspergillus pseudoustus TaxID=1810923 RepID=A0ABR4J7A2_9EURO